jgi:uncharacterized protein
MELEEKLKNLAKLNLKRARDIAPPQEKKKAVEEFGGKLIGNRFGEFVLIQKEFDLDQLHPDSVEAPQINFSGKSLSRICTSRKSSTSQTDPPNFDLRETIFLDCETTGLAGGSGTYAFLVGLGYLSGTQFRLEQYFMEDFHQERAVLTAVMERMSKFKFLVSFNGKCYDLPLLESRWLINRMEFDSSGWIHFDLLFPSRRLWKRRLGDCSLGNLEQEILSVKREVDVPSFMIPQIYFDYLRTGDVNPLIPVFEHNLHDILSMVKLSFLIDRVLDDYISVEIKHPLDLYSLGRIHYNFGNFQRCEEYYKQALTEAPPSDTRSIVCLSLAFVYKRMGLWEKASEVWSEIAEGDYPFQPRVYEELAKYYEHRMKDYPRALSLVENVMSFINSGCYSNGNPVDPRKSSADNTLSSWQYRKDRLLRKIERIQGKQSTD